jgi:hypothetical protein
MNDAYTPVTISAADLESVLARLDRYLNRHGSANGETPLPDSMREDVRQSIILEWMADDWIGRELDYIARNGRTLFPPTLSEIGRHLRAMLFHAGRARVRHWRQPGQAQGSAADHRRRDADDSRGAGMASRSADPALLVSAIESASGELVLPKNASARRSRKGLPNKLRGGMTAVLQDYADKRCRWFKTRNSVGYTLDVLARHADRTDIEIRRYVRFNFQRRGTILNRAMPTTQKRIPAGVTADTMREAFSGR